MDPNEVVGRPTESEVWLSPDWSNSKPYREGSSAPGRGWTRVSVRETLYANGKRVTQVLDENRKPVADDNGPRPPLSEEIDKDQETRFTRGQTQATRGDQEGDTRGPQTGETRDEFRGGKWVSVPNPQYQNTPAGKNAAELQRQRERNAALRADQDPAYETDQERRERSDARIKQQGAAATAAEDKAREARLDEERRQQQNKPGTAILRPDGKGGSIAIQTMPDGTVKTTPLPDVPTEAASKYKEVKQDPTTGQWSGFTADGRWEPIAGGPGAGPAGNQGPSLPMLVRGQSTAALRSYKDQLNQLVQLGPQNGGITSAVADKRWQEATALAGYAISEADTQQRDDESRRNADVNIRTNAMSNATSGFNSALDFVKSINGSLPVGSSAGGDAFVALLGMQEIQARRMGANRNEFSGGNRSPEANQIDAISRQTTGDTRSTINGLLNAPPSATEAAPVPPQAPGTPTAPASPAAVTAPALSSPAAGPPASAAPTSYLPSSAQAAANAGPVPGQDGGMWQPPTPASPDVDPVLNVRHKQTGEIKQVRLSEINNANDKDQFEVLDPNSTGTVQPSGPATTPQASPTPSDMPAATPMPEGPSQYGGGSDTQSAAPGMADWPVMARFGDPMAPPQAVAAAATPGAEAMPPAMRLAQIEAEVPWRLSQEDIDFAEQMGQGHRWRRVPGAVA